MLYSRSSSTRQPGPVSINLDNLEQLQDRWAKQYESSKCPPPPPELNSPRSLAACKRSGINPFKDLQKLSLMQHLLRLTNKLQFVEETVASLSQRLDLKMALQTAVLAFQHTTIGLGTSKEKLVAYMGFLNQEEVRVARLEELRRVRREIIEEEAMGCRGSQEGSAADESPSGAFSQIQHPDRSEDHGIVASAQKGVNPSLDRSPQTPRGLTAGSSSLAADATLPTYMEVDHQFPLSRKPYIPRDARALNTNFFGNRTFKPLEAVSNPSGAALLCAADEASSLGGFRPRQGGVRSERGVEIARTFPGSASPQPDGEGKKDPTEGLRGVQKRSGVGSTTSRTEPTTSSPTLPRGNRRPPPSEDEGLVKGTPDGSVSEAPLDNSVKKNTTYTPVIYGKESHEPLVYYCANPEPLLT
ncbi:unnamed protein product [Phytomonas sp. EM1]|nr:unnamed protein product [Phytomonas sp. EM1]|eukprot:CCW60697.1 unnamed protein product [Phytomonas sp. isolate EM1]